MGRGSAPHNRFNCLAVVADFSSSVLKRRPSKGAKARLLARLDLLLGSDVFDDHLRT